MTLIYAWLGLLTGAWIMAIYLLRRLWSDMIVLSSLNSLTSDMIMLPSITDPMVRQATIDRMRSVVDTIRRYDPAASYRAAASVDRATEFMGSR
jgi:hypothetical protein